LKKAEETRLSGKQKAVPFVLAQYGTAFVTEKEGFE